MHKLTQRNNINITDVRINFYSIITKSEEL